MKWDAVIVGAGIAGLGVGSILAREAGAKILVLDRYSNLGGRMACYPGRPSEGWRLDTGLHFVELGPKSSCHELNKRVGRDIAWGPFSETVEIWNGSKFINLAELVPMAPDDKAAFGKLLQRISSLTDQEIESWDDRSLQEWLWENAPQASVRELMTDLGMIMTTIPDAIDMAAGEVLYIARENLIKTKQVLAASYPKEGMLGITNGLAGVIHENGGRVQLDAEVQEVVIENGRTIGVKVRKGVSPYPEYYGVPETELVEADLVVCALPIYQLSNLLDFNLETSPLPGWWIKRITDIQNEITGLVGYMIGLSEPVIPQDKLCFFTALKTRRAGLPFQGFPASNFSPDVAPEGKQLLHTDLVCEHQEVADKFERARMLGRLWEDLKEMFPGLESKVEFKIPYYVDGCDGLARKPGLVGNYKPGLQAPGIRNLFFAGDTYRGRGLAINSAARSALLCSDQILAS